MENDDVELIQSILSGNDSAFSELVQKYQKSVHALAWRKIGDFQVAEEITQDAFLQAYRKLATLKNPNQFPGWIYVIASNLCRDWHRRKKPTMLSLEATDTKTLEKTSYERYLEEREKSATEHRREIVKNLLDKLPESERTVVTLHYLGEMTSDAISKFLGVSVNTIKSRLRRARKRLQEEEPMIRETLGGIQLSQSLTENIMEQIVHIKPSPVSSGRPLVPWAALGSAAIIVILLLGVSNQLLTRFQIPYSLDAQSESTIEIVDASIILDMQANPNTKRQFGRAVLTSQNNGTGQNISDGVFSAENKVASDKVSVIPHQWTQAQGPQSTDINELFYTSDNTLFAITPTGIYRMTENSTEWELTNNTIPTETNSNVQMAEREGVLYIVTDSEILASNDVGVTWISIGTHTVGTVIELLKTDDTFYLITENKIFISTDAGKEWQSIDHGIQNRKIRSAIAVGNSIFVGTNKGLYRLKRNQWEQLTVATFRTINSLVASDNTLYIGTIPDDTELSPLELKTKLVREMMRNENSTNWEIFRSDDLGDTWVKITPTNRSFLDILPSEGRILASGDTLLAFGILNVYRSKDRGETWRDLGITGNAFITGDSQAVAQNEEIFYKEGDNKLLRSVDAGRSWEKYMDGIVGSDFSSLVSFNDRLYAYSGQDIVQSTDGGNDWTNVFLDADDEPNLKMFNNSLYAIGSNNNRRHICRLSDIGDEFVPIQGLPAIEKENLLQNIINNPTGHTNTHDSSEELDMLANRVRHLRLVFDNPKISGIAYSDDTFYVVVNHRLYKCRQGYPKWIDMGLDTGDDFNEIGLSFAVFGETLYIGRNDGKLYRSLDAGNNWIDITSTLPIGFTRFYEIIFVNSTVYVATDNGVLTSESGRDWRILTDTVNSNIIMISIAVDESTVYGASQHGIYKLDQHDRWRRISPDVPDLVEELVIHNDKFYILTTNKGMFHIPLDKK